jgi:hypothetical protein
VIATAKFLESGFSTSQADLSKAKLLLELVSAWLDLDMLSCVFIKQQDEYPPPDNGGIR